LSFPVDITEKNPVLIVGQGLAGTNVAFKLLQLKIPFKVIDNRHHNSASMVAAGLFNPLVFKWITKSWKARLLLSEANSTYRSLEQLLGGKYIENQPLIRIIASAQEQKQWQRRENQEDFENLILPEVQTIKAQWDKGFGNRGVAGSGWLDIKSLLQDFRAMLATENKLIEAEMDYNEIQISEQLTYKGEPHSYIICCDGAAVSQNPFFTNLKFSHTKGEVLDVKSSELALNRMLNNGQFVIPLGNENYRIGTNFDWEDLTPVPTDVVKQELVNGFSEFFKIIPQVTDHRAGIRPSTPDRRPYAGRSTAHQNVCIMNGMGSKGVLLAPWCASQLCNHLFSGQPIHPDIDVSRTMFSV
jgi:glycine oxidase